ncbi:unnamed protein product [Amoebophrya sp. A120]|nr:unnamed protein product [Amoebophrya sp. A120]|eukprot:GSA120T00008527001.1
MNFTADFLFALVMTSVLLCVDLFVVFAAAYDAGEGQKSTADIAADAEFFSEPAAEDGTAADQTVLQMKPAVAVPAGTTAQQLLRMGCVGVDEGSEYLLSLLHKRCVRFQHRRESVGSLFGCCLMFFQKMSACILVLLLYRSTQKIKSNSLSLILDVATQEFLQLRQQQV